MLACYAIVLSMIPTNLRTNISAIIILVLWQFIDRIPEEFQSIMALNTLIMIIYTLSIAKHIIFGIIIAVSGYVLIMMYNIYKSIYMKMNDRLTING
jgi:hypothetical protein